MSINQTASLVIQVAPFISIIAIELLRPGFERRLEMVMQEYANDRMLKSDQKNDFMDYAKFSFDYENAIEHLELTLIAIVVVFVGKFVARPAQETIIRIGILFVGSILLITIIRFGTKRYFEKRQPHLYQREDFVYTVRYGELIVIASNFLIIILIIISETF